MKITSIIRYIRKYCSFQSFKSVSKFFLRILNRLPILIFIFPVLLIMSGIVFFFVFRKKHSKHFDQDSYSPEVPDLVPPSEESEEE